MLVVYAVTPTWPVVGKPFGPKLEIVFGFGGYPNSECGSLGIA